MTDHTGETPSVRETRAEAAQGGLKLVVGICTFRRQSVHGTLDSLTKLNLPDGATLSVVVADNDETAVRGAEFVEASQTLDLDIHYVHAPARNISIARNACLDTAIHTLDGDFLAFIDDDEIATPDWIAGLLRRQLETGAGAVFGPAHAIYPDDAPKWMVENDYHSNLPTFRPGGFVETGHSSNVLLNLNDPKLRETRFNQAFGTTGGEDVDIFFRLGRSGMVMAVTDSGKVHEHVAPARLDTQWMLDRSYWNGQVYGHCRNWSGQSAPLPVRLRFAGIAMTKSAYCAIRAATTLRSRSKFWSWFLRASFHTGVVAGVISRPRTSNYGMD